MDTRVPNVYAGQLSFGNDDADENPFNFRVKGTVTPLAPIVDDEDPNHHLTGTWLQVNRNGVNNDFYYSKVDKAPATSSWTFNSLDPGTYRVSVTWQRHSNRATNAPFTLYDGAVDIGTVNVNQQLPPSDFFDAGRPFQDLGNFSILNGRLTVELSNLVTNPVPGQIVVADAVRIERVN